MSGNVVGLAGESISSIGTAGSFGSIGQQIGASNAWDTQGRALNMGRSNENMSLLGQGGNLVGLQILI